MPAFVISVITDICHLQENDKQGDSPVSYTHLSTSHVLFCNSEGVSYYDYRPMVSFMAVSYTHLDVYKRQEEAQLVDENKSDSYWGDIFQNED